MDFDSFVFFVWLLLFVLAFRISPKKHGQYFLVVFGIAFVFYASPMAGAILIVESLVCYYTCLLRKPEQWLPTVLSVSFVFTAFLLCKYMASKNSIILPLGISYFSFRLIHYVQESYKQRLRKHSLLEFMAFITFFPTFLAGPINLFPEFLQNLRRRKWDNSRFSYGLERLIYGYAQLTILGNFAVNHLLKGWIAVQFPTNDNFSGLSAHAVYLWLDLYVRFSAYSGIAIGIAAIAGFAVPENFNFPFLASNIREFWLRWHMSLTDLCREYIFKPLAAITRKPLLALSVTMITIGIWHELSLRYFLWGLYHTLGIIVYEKYSKLIKEKIPDRKALFIVRRVVGMIITIAFVVMSFPVTSVVNDYIMNLLK